MNFEKQFKKTKPIIQGYAKRYAKATGIPREEYESALCEEFAKRAMIYDGRIPFTAFIKPILTQKALKVASRKERKFYDNVLHTDGMIDEDCNPTFEFISEVDIEKEVISPTKKCADKLQLIHALTSQADEITTAIVKRMLENPDATKNSIATELGIHHQIVDRRLRRLAKNYDEKRFGDVSQYLAI